MFRRRARVRRRVAAKGGSDEHFARLPQPEILAAYTVRTADIATGIVKFVNPARTSFSGGPSVVNLLAPGEKAWSDPSVVVLPAAALVLAVTPYISRIMRGSMIEVLESEYVTMARLKGLPERTVIWRHAVPNAIVPAIRSVWWLSGGSPTGWSLNATAPTYVSSTDHRSPTACRHGRAASASRGMNRSTHRYT